MRYPFSYPYLTRNLTRILPLVLGASLTGIGCGQISESSNPIDPSQIVVRSTIKINVNAGDSPSNPAASIENHALTADLDQPITVIDSPQTSTTLNNSDFSPPTITPNVLDFGNLGLSSLVDNNLQVCGTSGNTKCNTALIRMYTTGVAGAGLYNSVGGYGAPLLVTLGSNIPSIVGLGVSNAVILQTYSIPSGQNVMRLSNFAQSALYDIKADFTNAGAGSYSTTIVIEYALAP